jgi:hypothetical protein
MKMATLEIIEECLGKKRLAIIGISRQPEDFSRALWKELVKRGYEVRLVNPNTTEIDGEKCYSSVKEIVPPVEWTLIMTPPQVTKRELIWCGYTGVAELVQSVTKRWLIAKRSECGLCRGTVHLCSCHRPSSSIKCTAFSKKWWVHILNRNKSILKIT